MLIIIDLVDRRIAFVIYKLLARAFPDRIRVEGLVEFFRNNHTVLFTLEEWITLTDFIQV